MSTPTLYSDIYSTVLSKITDYSLSGLTDADIDSTLFPFLKSAITRFKHCRQDLSNRDDTNGTFNISLTDDEQEILACLCTAEWLKPKILDVILLKQKMTDKDFQIYSSSNQINTLVKLRNDMKQEVQTLIKNYTFDTDLSKLKYGDNSDGVVG